MEPIAKLLLLGKSDDFLVTISNVSVADRSADAAHTE